MKNKQMTFGALLSYATIAFNIISGLLYTPWMIKTIGDDHYALYTLALSIINIFLMDFGIGSAVTKFLSNYYARGEYKEADRFMGIVYKTFIAISAGIAVVLVVFYFQIDWIYAKFTADEIVILKRLFIIVGVSSVASFPFTTFNGVLTATENFIELKLCSFGQKVLDVALIVIFLLLGKGVYTLVLVHAFSNFVFLTAKYLVIRFRTRQRTDMRHWDSGVAKSLFGFSAWFTVMSIAKRCIFNIMPTVIAALIGSTEVTLFSIAATLESYVFTFTDAVNGMFMPRVSRIINGEDESADLGDLMIKVGKFHIYTVGLLLIGFACVGEQFVGLWLGDGYGIVYGCTILLILPSLVETPQQIARTSLLVKDVVKEQAILYVVMAAVNLVFAYILLPIFGVIGAAMSVFLAYSTKIVGLNLLYHKHLPIKLGHYFKTAYGKWLIVAAITLMIGFGTNYVVPMNGWLGLILKIMVICGVYLVLIATVCMDREARNGVMRFIRKK